MERKWGLVLQNQRKMIVLSINQKLQPLVITLSNNKNRINFKQNYPKVLSLKNILDLSLLKKVILIFFQLFQILNRLKIKTKLFPNLKKQDL